MPKHPCAIKKKSADQNGKDRATRAVADALLRGEKVAAIPLKSDTTEKQPFLVFFLSSILSSVVDVFVKQFVQNPQKQPRRKHTANRSPLFDS